MTRRQANWIIAIWFACFLAVIVAAYFTVRNPPKEMRRYPKYCYDAEHIELSGLCSVSQSNVQLDI